MHQGSNDVFGWFKSSFCGSQGNNCVEIAQLPDAVAVRDGKDSAGPALRFTPAEWLAFLSRARRGDFDLAGPA